MVIADNHPVVIVAKPGELRSSVVAKLGERGLMCRSFDRIEEAWEMVVSQPVSVLLLEVRSGDRNLAQTIGDIGHRHPLLDVVPFAREAGTTTVLEAFRAGARDFYVGEDPTQIAELTFNAVQHQTKIPRPQRIRDSVATEWKFEGLRSHSRKMWDIFETVERIADTPATVLIEGETGTGKELLARAIHRRSHLRSKPFLAVDCGALPETLLDSELFGHEKGAFTGAVRQKAGLFEKANGGTLFLDEIANVSESLQQRLLRVIETGSFRRVGGTEELWTDVRIIAATNRKLKSVVDAGGFREDLYYRLNVITLRLPTLRERPEDILFLFSFFLRRFARQYNTHPPRITGAVADLLLSYSWPGNVRELQNLAERLLLVVRGEEVRPHHLPLALLGEQQEERTEKRTESSPHVDISMSLASAVSRQTERVEREYLERVLDKYRGRVTQCARHAGISRRTLYRKMQRYGLEKETFKHSTRKLTRKERHDHEIKEPI
jgi:two-component system NtrC family response regulator